VEKLLVCLGQTRAYCFLRGLGVYSWPFSPGRFFNWRQKNRRLKTLVGVRHSRSTLCTDPGVSQNTVYRSLSNLIRPER
jgi:hypothetical protein